MKVTLSWLKEILNIKISNKRLITQLIMLGIDVEKINNLFINRSINKIFIAGKIINFLQYTYNKFIYTIDFGGSIKVDLYSSKDVRSFLNKIVIVILSNRFVYLSKDRSFLVSFYKYNKKKLLCDFFVYNYYDITEGKHSIFSIVEIFENINLGKVLNRYLNLTDKWIKLSIALNRSDLKNLIGICREVYALNKKVYSYIPEYLYKKQFIGTFFNYKEEVSIKLKTEEKYFFYVGRLITDVCYNLNHIPFWMYNRLLISDRISNHPLLNIINYIFIETGIIINIYDVEIIGKEIIITTKKDFYYKNNFNNSLKELNNTALFTTNHNKQILYSVGSLDCNKNYITNISKNLYIESISLTNEFIHDLDNLYLKDIKKEKIQSCIYDSNILIYAIQKASKLINKLFGGNIGHLNILGNKNKLFFTNKILLPIKKIKNLIGQTIRLKNIKIILKNLKFNTNIINSTYLEITPPIWRRDIHIFQDIIEEIVKFYGYDRIKLKPILINHNIYNINPINEYIFIDKIKDLLINKGYQEIITYSLVDIKLQSLLFSKYNTALSIINPISNELSCIRNSLLNGLLTNIIYNQNYQANRLKLFELGLCYDKHIDVLGKNIKNNSVLTQNLFFKEKCILAGAIYGNKYDRRWCLPSKLPDIYDIKGDIENIFEIFSISPDKLIFYIPKKHDYIFNKNYFGYIYYEKNNILGKFGVIDTNLLNILKIKNQIIYFELYIYKIFTIFKKSKKKEYKYQLSYLPIYERDISFVVNNDIPSIFLIQECKNILKKYLLHIDVFDIYTDKKMKHNNSKSIGIHFILQDMNHTLNHKEINIILNDCINGLINKFKIQLRQVDCG